jgi:hypothetical protein
MMFYSVTHRCCANWFNSNALIPKALWLIIVSPVEYINTDLILYLGANKFPPGSKRCGVFYVWNDMNIPCHSPLTCICVCVGVYFCVCVVYACVYAFMHLHIHDNPRVHPWNLSASGNTPILHFSGYNISSLLSTASPFCPPDLHLVIFHSLYEMRRVASPGKLTGSRHGE